MQAVTALAHLKASVLFMMDVSEQCDHTIEEQINLFESIRPLFANKPVFVGLNKVDIIRRGEIAPEKQALLEKLEKNDIPICELSTVSKEGVITLRDRACDALMAQRVQRKLQSKGYDNNIISRLYVAIPEPRDEKVRAPYIPPGALVKRTERAALKDNRNVERMEVDPPQKKTIIPEIWEGHNISDFLREDIEELFADLTKEERERIEAGVYDKDLDSDDEETKKLLRRAVQIREKEELAKQEFRFKKGTDQPVVPRKIGQKSKRTMEHFENEMSKLGVDISKKKMKNLEGDSARPIRGKRIRVGRSQSLSGNTALPRDVQGVPDLETFDKAKKSKRKGQRPAQQDARKGEGDRHVYDMKPKHLFSGKRGMGKTTRR
uniref:Nucleolar GTP-binding protein 1 n=1 Tax=Panagrolaimus sp. PS1159 TaxID=55785 RepID=A0AC35FSF1_9BILA